jgi:hypothetical protein
MMAWRKRLNNELFLPNVLVVFFPSRDVENNPSLVLFPLALAIKRPRNRSHSQLGHTE